MSKSDRPDKTLLGLNGRSSQKTKNTMQSAEEPKMSRPRDEPPLDYEYQNPAERYNQLPESTRKWLESLREEDIDKIREFADIMLRAKLFASVIKWTLVTSLGAMIFGLQFGETLAKYFAWFTGGGK
jgi:hypothetical protein